MQTSDTTESSDPWENRAVDLGRGGDAYERFLERYRDLQDSVSRSNPPEQVWDDLAGACEKATRRLDQWAADERQQPAGTRMTLPGRGHPFLLPFIAEVWTDSLVQGWVVFRRFHLGGNGAAHGGALPLLFDEVLGRLSNSGQRPTARTAYLTVSYRSITPVGTELHLEATLDRIEGRKRWVTGRLTHDGELLADAEGLFVQLRPGQP